MKNVLIMVNKLKELDPPIDFLLEQIELRRETLGVLVGNLYPGIIQIEITEIYELIDKKRNPPVVKCKECNKKPIEIQEYIDMAKEEEMGIEEYVIENEGTYNPDTKLFLCTDCYIKLEMPLGLA